MFRTPLGRPASMSSSAMSRLDRGTFSDGLSRNVLPQVIATGYIHSGTLAGKLKGAIPAQTPRGCRIVSQSTLRAMLAIDSPMIKLGMPQANSTTSIPRRTDALASGRVLPCSRVTVRAISSQFSSSLFLNLNMRRARSTTGTSFHSRAAACAACTAASTSSAPHIGTLAMTPPVEGFVTSPNSVAFESTHCPPTSILQVVAFSDCVTAIASPPQSGCMASEYLLYFQLTTNRRPDARFGRYIFFKLRDPGRYRQLLTSINVPIRE